MEPVNRPSIASPANPRIRAAAGLRDRRDRERTGRTLIDGAREVGRAIDAGVILEAIFVCEALCRSDACLAFLERVGPGDPRIVPVTAAAFAKVAFGERAEGVVAIAVTPAVDLGSLTLPPDPLIGVLEGVEKPGNLGAIARSADGAGVDALIVADPRTDLFNPNAIRASLGTLFGLRLGAADAMGTLAWLHGSGLRIVVARVDGSRLYTETDLTGPLAIVLGGEAEGLTEAWGGRDVDAVRLPMHGMADSLNVSVAAGILFYEARRQRDLAPTTAERAPTTARRAATMDHG